MSKYIFDFIHGDIKFSPLMLKIIDTPEFQRMKYMSQLGSSRFVFPSANGDRFSHSLGVCYLAGYVGKHLQSLHPKIVSNRKIELLSIAGLIHDIGHGPFSHVFDYILEDSKNKLKKHEERSKWIFRYMVKKYNIPLKCEEVNYICEIIDPSEIFHEYCWDYQIISGIVDVDRLDYILRDSKNSGVHISLSKTQVERLIRMMSIVNNQIYFDPKAAHTIKNLLNSRKDMFQIVYRHKTAIAVDDMLKDTLKGVSFIEKYNLEKILTDIEKFLQLDDSLLRQIYYDTKVPINVKKIIDRIWKRDFYKIDKKYIYKKIKIDINFTKPVDKNLFKDF